MAFMQIPVIKVQNTRLKTIQTIIIEIISIHYRTTINLPKYLLTQRVITAIILLTTAFKIPIAILAGEAVLRKRL